MNCWWLLFLLNVPLIQEVTRKYFIYSDLVFLGADALVVGTTIALGLQGKLNFRSLPPVFLLLSTLFIGLTAVNHAISGHHIGIYGVGLRATFLPVFYMLISSRYLSVVEDGYERIFQCVNVWILIIGVMALLQVVLGKEHPINAVWGKTALGIGDFTTRDKGVLIPGLFRPTSIFTHTGKFGQVIFTLVLFKWCYLLFSPVRRSRALYLFMIFDLAVVFTSGQRAALMFLVLAMFMVTAMNSREPQTSFPRIAISASIMAAGLLGIWFAKPDLAAAVYDRFASVITAVPIRLEGNLWLPIQTMLEGYLFSGEGLGYFTFGSRLFGGAQVYQIEMEGLGESSLIRLCGEVGVVATLLLVIAYLSLVAKGLRISKTLLGTSVASGALFFSIWVVCLMLWSNTADVFANSVVMSLGYALSGAIMWKAQLTLRSEVHSGVHFNEYGIYERHAKRNELSS